MPQTFTALTASTCSPRSSRAMGNRPKLKEGPLHPKPDAETLSASNVAPVGSIKVKDKVVDSGPTELVDMEALRTSPAHKTAL